jgi:ubiquinone/menaquinone biosynthesis C-methylase UbiE
MKTSVYIILGTIGLVILISIIWRLASRHQALPCPVWLRWLVELDNPFTKTNRAAFIVEHLYLESGMAVLDAGCGPGRLIIPIAEQVGNQGTVIAMDVQAGMLSLAKEKTQAAGLKNVEFLHAGIGEGKLENKLFDRALLVTVLGEIMDQRKALKEIFDALNPGGILSVTEIIFDPHFQSRSKVTHLASEIGFREKDFFGNHIAFVANFVKPNKC